MSISSHLLGRMMVRVISILELASWSTEWLVSEVFPKFRHLFLSIWDTRLLIVRLFMLFLDKHLFHPWGWSVLHAGICWKNQIVITYLKFVLHCSFCPDDNRVFLTVHFFGMGFFFGPLRWRMTFFVASRGQTVSTSSLGLRPWVTHPISTLESGLFTHTETPVFPFELLMLALSLLSLTILLQPTKVAKKKYLSKKTTIKRQHWHENK